MRAPHRDGHVAASHVCYSRPEAVRGEQQAATVDTCRQQARVHQPSPGYMIQRAQDRTGLYPTGQAHEERLYRAAQWKHPPQTTERQCLPNPGQSPE